MFNSLVKIKRNIAISLSTFFVLVFITLSYFIMIEKNGSYFIKYSVDYDNQFIDTTFYRLNLNRQLPEADYTKGKDSYIDCGSKEKCLKIIEVYQKKIHNLNEKLWETTRSFITNYIILPDIKKSGKKPDGSIPTEIEKSEIGDKLNIYLNKESTSLTSSGYRYLLNLEYLIQTEKPTLLMVSFKLVNNTWNKIFTNFFMFGIIIFFLSLTLFIFLHFFFPAKRYKK